MGEGQPSSPIVIAYVPVVHRGYLHFFESQPITTHIGILSDELNQNYEPLQKDIRSLKAAQIVTSLQGLLPDRKIVIVDQQHLDSLNSTDQEIIMPDEDISRQVAGKFLTKAKVAFMSVFLRWDRSRTTQETKPTPSASMSLDSFVVKMVNQATKLGERSADWWRQVGAILVKDGEVVLEAINHHVPHQQQPYLVGDPRANFHKGEKIELSTAIHAEASLIAQAAQRGVAVAGAQLFVSTFPCPVCAKLIAESGITEVYYGQGYAMLDGEEILASKKIKVFAVDLGLSQV